MTSVDEYKRGIAWQQQAEAVVAAIPPGHLMAYGDLAAACGHPGAARMAGLIAYLGSPGLPWQRVVRAGGLLSRSSENGSDWQREALKTEGVSVTASGRVADFAARRWTPGKD
jgi:methylated-DNA-protein-cysteine methyltransferase-like protein